MKKIDIGKNENLRKLDERVHARLGDNLYLIMLIMSVLFVFSALVVGLLGRGWVAAWFLVFLGITLGFFPCLRYLLIYLKGKEEIGEDLREDAATEGSGEDIKIEEAASPEHMTDEDRDDEEAARIAVEIEAMLARDKLKKQQELREKEEELRRREEEILKEARRREREKLLDEERKKEKREQERRRKIEENRAKWEKSRQRTVYKTENFTSKGTGYFDGIRSNEELKKKYKELVKKYHPDNGGNADMMHEIQKQYHELDTFFKSYEKHKH